VKGKEGGDQRKPGGKDRTETTFEGSQLNNLSPGGRAAVVSKEKRGGKTPERSRRQGSARTSMWGEIGREEQRKKGKKGTGND